MNEQEIRDARFEGAMIAAKGWGYGTLEGVGKIVDYEMDPTVTIERPDGTRFTVTADRLERATIEQVVEAQKEALANLKKQRA